MLGVVVSGVLATLTTHAAVDDNKFKSEQARCYVRQMHLRRKRIFDRD
jgi:hypothetical protein